MVGFEALEVLKSKRCSKERRHAAKYKIRDKVGFEDF
jgi:hypothetical protein